MGPTILAGLSWDQHVLFFKILSFYRCFFLIGQDSPQSQAEPFVPVPQRDVTSPTVCKVSYKGIASLGHEKGLTLSRWAPYVESQRSSLKSRLTIVFFLWDLVILMLLRNVSPCAKNLYYSYFGVI